jgi:hypothetical protein
MVKVGKIRFQGRGSEGRAQEVGRKPEIVKSVGLTPLVEATPGLRVIAYLRAL